MASYEQALADRLRAAALDGPPGDGAPYPMSRQSTIAHPAEQTYGYSTSRCIELGWIGLDWVGSHALTESSPLPRSRTRPGYGYAYAARTMRKTVPKYELPEGPLPANVVKTLIDDEVGRVYRVVVAVGRFGGGLGALHTT